MAGIEEAFEKFSDRIDREERKKYIKNQQGDYVEYSSGQNEYPVTLGPLQLGVNANVVSGKYEPSPYDKVSTTNSNVGLRGKYNIPDSDVSLLGSIGDVRSSQKIRTDLPFNPMTGEATPYSQTERNVYKDNPYSVGAQYSPRGTNELYSALYNKGGGYNFGYNKGPVNVSYTSNPGLGNNIMLRGQYNFAEGGRVSMSDGGIASFANGGKASSKKNKLVQRVSSREEPQDEYGDAQTGEKRIPLMQGIKRGYDFENTMPNIYNQRYDYENEMPIYNDDRYSIPQQELAYGGLTKTVAPVKGPNPQGVESLFKRRYN